MNGRKPTIFPSSMRPDVVGPRITAARLALGLTQAEIAGALEVDPSAWAKYERGKRPLPPDIARRASERYGLSMDYFYRGRLDSVAPAVRSAILDLA